MSQLKISKSNNRDISPREKSGSEQFRYISTLNGTGTIYCPSTIKPKLGFELMRSYPIGLEFDLYNKKRAVMLYNCLKYFPGFIDKEVDNVTNAVLHVYEQCANLIGNLAFGFNIELVRLNNFDIPEEYQLEIIYEEFSPFGEAWWCEYKDLFLKTKDDIPLRNAILMCIQIITQDFGFSIFDNQQVSNILTIRDWYEWESNNDDYETEQEIIYKQVEIDACYEDFCSNGLKIVKAINSIRIRKSLIRKCIEENQGNDIAIWMTHVLFLLKKKFNIKNHSPATFDTQESEHYDETSPVANFGFIYDLGSLYAKSISDNFSEYSNNYGMQTICNFMIINNKRGIIRPLTTDPILAWVANLFSFNLSTFTYENRRYL